MSIIGRYIFRKTATMKFDFYKNLLQSLMAKINPQRIDLSPALVQQGGELSPQAPPPGLANASTDPNQGSKA